MTVAIQTDLFRALLRRHAAGVVVVTAERASRVPYRQATCDEGHRPAGFTATSFTSVSLDPPLVSFCLNRASSSWPVVADVDHVAVHVLADGQEDLARRFATSGVDRFAAPTQWSHGPHGVPILDGVSAVLVCRVAERVPAGDHVIVLAELVDGQHTADDSGPLLYHMGRYLRAA